MLKNATKNIGKINEESIFPLNYLHADKLDTNRNLRPPKTLVPLAPYLDARNSSPLMMAGDKIEKKSNFNRYTESLANKQKQREKSLSINSKHSKQQSSKQLSQQQSYQHIEINLNSLDDVS